MYIYAYNNASESASALKEALGAKLIRTVNSRFRGSPDKNVINWGNSAPNAEVDQCNVLNHPSKVKFATNKKDFFEVAGDAGVSIPEYTEDLDLVTQWIERGATVFSRETLTGHSGRGIIIIDSMPVWEDYDHSLAKLFVKYIPKKDEYRIHIFKGQVIDIQKKSTAYGDRAPDYRIRNRDTGFIFTRENANPPEQVVQQALEAIAATDLDFGGVDVIYNEYRQKAYVLEVNTAVGMEGTTLTKYAEAFAGFFGVALNSAVEVDDLEEPQESLITARPSRRMTRAVHPSEVAMTFAQALDRARANLISPNPAPQPFAQHHSHQDAMQTLSTWSMVEEQVVPQADTVQTVDNTDL